MRLISEVLERLRSLVDRHREARELAEEIRHHIELETRKNIREGMSPADARRAAHVAFGGVDRWTEEWREARGVGPFERFARDLRLASRRLLREPSLTVPAVLTLAVGIGATTAAFALVYAILMRPLPYVEPDRIVEFGHAAPGLGVEAAGQSTGTYLYYRDDNRSFAETAIYTENAVSVNVTDGDTPEHVRVAMVSSSFFPLLGVPAERGRWFAEGEGYWEPGMEYGPVIISHDLWVRRYGADPDVVGGRIELNQSPRDVIGVMPPGFDFPHPDTDVWYSFEEPVRGSDIRDLYRTSVARLLPGVDVESARADLERLGARLPEVFEDVTPAMVEEGGLRPTVTALHARIVEPVARPIRILAVTAVLVLFVTLANVAGLFLVRAERRRRELAVSRAMGAGRLDLIVRFAAEGLILALLGGGLALLVASALVEARFGMEPTALPRLQELDFGLVPSAFGVAASLVAGLVVSGLSMLRSRSFSASTAGLSTAGRAVGGLGWRRVHGALAALQVALSLSLLVASNALVQSLIRLSRVDPGFEAESVVSFHVAAPGAAYPSYHEVRALYTEMLGRLEALPGVTAVAATERLPLTDPPASWLERVELAGAPRAEDAPPASGNLVSPDYFELMGIPLVAGEAFGPLDARPEAPPIVISQGLARQLFGDADPIGATVRLPRYDGYYPDYTIAGVVADVPGANLAREFERTLYFPALFGDAVHADLVGAYPNVPFSMTIAVRGDLATPGLFTGFQDIVRGLDPKLSLAELATLEDLLADATAGLRLVALLTALAAVAALVLGVAGVYGIVAYSVSRRTSEIGVRIALGASKAGVERLVMTQTVRVAALGAAGGLFGAYALTRALQGMLYEVSPASPVAYVTSLALLFAVVSAAGWLPARRAGRLDVVAALGTS